MAFSKCSCSNKKEFDLLVIVAYDNPTLHANEEF